MNCFNKIKYIFLFVTLKISGNTKYIQEQNIKESSIKDKKIYLYPLEINKKSYIKTQDDNKKYIMMDHGKIFCVFKYNKKNYILSTNGCYCCFNNCYATLIKNKYSKSCISPEFQDLEEELKKNNITPIRFEYDNFLICNEFLKFKNKKCCISCKPRFFSDTKINKNKLMKMILITDNKFENEAVTLDLVENVKNN